MDFIHSNLEAGIPVGFAVLSLIFFTLKTRWFSYSIILMTVGAELIPLTVNTTALLACISCFIGLLIREFMQSHPLEKPFFTKHLS